MAKFMVCDDSKFMQGVSEKLIKKMGHEVLVTATDGEQAVQTYLENWYDIDVVLLDVVMPVLDGLQTLKQILEINPFAKVIMVTSISNTSIVQGCMRVGAKDYVVKPFRLSEFVKTISDVLSEEQQP